MSSPPTLSSSPSSNLPRLSYLEWKEQHQQRLPAFANAQVVPVTDEEIQVELKKPLTSDTVELSSVHSGLSMASKCPETVEEYKDNSALEDSVNHVGTNFRLHDPGWWRQYEEVLQAPAPSADAFKEKMQQLFLDEERKQIELEQQKQNETENIQLPRNKKELEAYREPFVTKFYKQGAQKKEKKLNIVMGLSGSGKSSVIVERLQQKGEGALLIDSDHIKPLLPEYNNGKGAQAVHTASANIAAECMNDAIKNKGDNIIYPTVGSKTTGIEQLLDRAKRNEYRVKLHLAHLPPEVAAKRVFRRMHQQFVSPELPLKDDYAPTRNFERLKHRPEVREYSVWDTVPQGGRLMEYVIKANQDDQKDVQ